MDPRPRHSNNSRSSKTLPMASSASLLPPSGTARLYWFSISWRPSAIYFSTIQVARRMSSGSKPAMPRHMIVLLMRDVEAGGDGRLPERQTYVVGGNFCM